MTVQIRFNTNFPSKSNFEWRLLVDGQETLVNQVRLDVASWTTSEFIEGLGQKWHLTAEATDVKVLESAGKKVAYVK
jgi:hypothetical protein